jgi:hypothetical protein
MTRMTLIFADFQHDVDRDVDGPCVLKTGKVCF